MFMCHVTVSFLPHYCLLALFIVSSLILLYFLRYFHRYLFSMSSLMCVGADKFCFVCGKFTVARNSKNISDSIVQAYEFYFSKQFIKNVWWAPKIICTCCYNGLQNWANKKRNSMSFGVPMIWSNPSRHHPAECYFCINNATNHRAKYVKKIVQKSSPHASIPKPHSEDVPIPKRISNQSNNSGENPPELDVAPPETVSYVASTVDHEVNYPQLISQKLFNDLVRALKLSIHLAEVLGSRLKQWNLLEPGVKHTDQRRRQEGLKVFFSENETKSSGFCSDIFGLMEYMYIVYDPDEWRLFIDSSKSSLKAVCYYITVICYHPSPFSTPSRPKKILTAWN